MLRIVNKSSLIIKKSTISSAVCRSFCVKLSIPVDAQHQGGRRKEELDAEARGEIGFNRDPIIPPADAGTKENPILVPSEAHSRAVGFEDPATHQLQWFNLKSSPPLHFVPSLGLYFKLKHV